MEIVREFGRCSKNRWMMQLERQCVRIKKKKEKYDFEITRGPVEAGENMFRRARTMSFGHKIETRASDFFYKNTNIHGLSRSDLQPG